MRIIAESRTARWFLGGLGIIVYLAVVAWLLKTYAAETVASRTNVQDLRLATRLDPGNANFHFQLSRLFRYSPEDINPDEALDQLQQAIRSNPRDPDAWLELGFAMANAGRIRDAQLCLRSVESLAPHDPTLQWAIGNSFLQQGDLDEAFRHFKVVLAESSDYDQILFSTAWKASGNGEQILNELIPPKLRPEFSYLNYLVSRNLYTEARNVWQRIVKSPDTFESMETAVYIDGLLAARQPAEAYRVWTDLRNKGVIKATYEETGTNLLINGDFEERILNMGFDWRVVALPGVSTDIDVTTYRSPGHSVLIEFSGKENVNYRHLFQYVRVVPGHTYTLRGFMKADGITTDSGPRLEVRDAYDSGAFDKFSADLRASTTGWNSVTLEFKVGPKTNLILVSVTRLPSQKFDNLIGGRVNIDDLTLSETQKE